MDGLPVAELTALEFASRNEDTMHGCGHDLHTSMMLGAARMLSESRHELRGDVLFMFQAGEEGHDGARHMLDEGLLDVPGVPVIAAYALHVFSGAIPTGTFAVRGGAIMSASDNLSVTVRGRGGHGSAPHQAADPIAAAAAMIIALQTMVTRRFDVFDPVVVTVTQMHAGQGSAIIPEVAEFVATVRSFSPEAQQRLSALCREVLQGVAGAHGVEVDVDYQKVYPATINDQHEAVFAADTVGRLFGATALQQPDAPLTASEDFSRVLERVPGVFIPLGATPHGADPATTPFNHSPYAVFDESVLTRGAALLAQLGANRLDVEALQ
jgi:hippurate hydrolase